MALWTRWKWSGYDTYAFNHDLALQHLSLGAHDLCFDVVRVCEETYIDTDGTEYQNPFAGITEQCSACLDNKFEVILPELDENYCGMNEAQWHQEFMNGTHCIDASNNFIVPLEGTPGNDLIIGNGMPNIINGKAGDDCTTAKVAPTGSTAIGAMIISMAVLTTIVSTAAGERIMSPAEWEMTP